MMRPIQIWMDFRVLACRRTGAVAKKQDFGTSCRQLGDYLNLPISRVKVWLGRRKGCTSRAKQTSQIFTFLPSHPIRHVRYEPSETSVSGFHLVASLAGPTASLQSVVRYSGHFSGYAHALQWHGLRREYA